jgi:ribosomal protein L12E/L44/L45/RPP1/RPP2
LPPAWKTLLYQSQITKEEMASNPQAVIEVLGFFAENLAEKAKRVDVHKALDDVQISESSSKKQGNSPAAARSANKADENASDKSGDVQKESSVEETAKDYKEARLSGLNDNALLEILST